MKVKYDREADAMYIYLSSKPYAYGKDLDDERRIDYASDNTPMGVELLCASKGVNLEGLPGVDEIARTVEDNGIKIYTMKQRVHTEPGQSVVLFEVNLGSSATRGQRAQAARFKEEVTV